MELFNKKYVHFMWDDSLKGKSVFVSDHIDSLRNYVNNKVVVRVTVNNSINPNYPFYTDEAFFKFVYYDPNYDYKLAFSNGDTVEVCIDDIEDTWTTVESLNELDFPTYTYRIKGELKGEIMEEPVTYRSKINMELFNKNYVHCVWEDSLNGKSVFFSDNIKNLYDYVNDNCHDMNDTVNPTYELDYPFSDSNNTPYRFVYYDPNYNYKLAFSKGDTVEMCINKSKNKWVYVSDLDDLDDPTGTYRIVLKDEDPEELVTYEELAEWLTKGNGLVMDNATCKVSTGLNLTSNQLEDIVSKDCLVRRHGDKGWHSPTKEYIYNK